MYDGPLDKELKRAMMSDLYTTQPDKHAGYRASTEMPVVYRASQCREMAEAIRHVYNVYSKSPNYNMTEQDILRLCAKFVDENSTTSAAFYTTDANGAINAGAGGFVTPSFWDQSLIGDCKFIVSIRHRKPTRAQLKAIVRTFRDWCLSMGAQKVFMAHSTGLVKDYVFARLVEDAGYQRTGYEYTYRSV